jgi:hypothetical protein
MVDVQNNVITTFKTKVDTTSMTAVKQAMQDQAKRLKVANDLMKESGLSASQLNIGLKNMGIVLSKNGQLTDLFGNNLKKADINMKKLRMNAWRFNMNMLTLMFGFMALNRVLTQFGKSVITTYQKANEETQGLGKATWQLQAAWEFFKYSLVDALTQSPLFLMLVQWLTQLVMWFNKLTPATKAFIAIGIAILFIITLIGMWFAVLQPLFSFLATVIPWIAGLLVGGLGAAFWWVLAIIAIVVALWITNLGGFRDFVKATLGIVWLQFKDTFMSIWKLVKLIFQAIVAIFSGEWDKVLSITWEFLRVLLAFMLKAFISNIAVIVNVFSYAWNNVLLGLQNMINGAISLINKLIKALNRIPGVSIPLIPKINLEGLQTAYVTAENIKGIMDGINSKLGIDIGMNSKAPTLSSSATSDYKAPSIDNSVTTVSNTITIPETMTNKDEIAKYVMEQITDQLNRKNDSSTG